uniref:Uncharacterized protein n=1 Tax=Cacopsylla melanoneura TaxID=428564 RepID=A0A8D8VFU5_9HEMI
MMVLIGSGWVFLIMMVLAGSGWVFGFGGRKQNANRNQKNRPLHGRRNFSKHLPLCGWQVVGRRFSYDYQIFRSILPDIICSPIVLTLATKLEFHSNFLSR